MGRPEGRCDLTHIRYDELKNEGENQRRKLMASNGGSPGFERRNDHDSCSKRYQRGDRLQSERATLRVGIILLKGTLHG